MKRLFTLAWLLALLSPVFAAPILIPPASSSSSSGGSAPVGAAYQPSNNVFTDVNIFTNPASQSNSAVYSLKVEGSAMFSHMNDVASRGTTVVIRSQYGGVDGLAILVEGGLPFVVRSGGVDLFSVELDGDVIAPIRLVGNGSGLTNLSGVAPVGAAYLPSNQLYTGLNNFSRTPAALNDNVVEIRSTGTGSGSQRGLAIFQTEDAGAAFNIYTETTASLFTINGRGLVDVVSTNATTGLNVGGDTAISMRTGMVTAVNYGWRPAIGGTVVRQPAFLGVYTNQNATIVVPTGYADWYIDVGSNTEVRCMGLTTNDWKAKSAGSTLVP